MISKASELLELFIAAEKKALDGVEMPHMPTLGAAYEEIAKQGINQQFAIPKGLGLRVVSGFISVNGKLLPQQIDCMLVDGEGARYGRTDFFIYPIEQVLCVLEVKKTLAKADFLDAMEHLSAIKKEWAGHLETLVETDQFTADISALRVHYSQISGLAAPTTAKLGWRLSVTEGILFHALLQDYSAPAMVILGFGGYKTEHGLRQAFVDILESRVGAEKGFGIPSLPSLVLSNEFSLVKANGLPYILKWNDNSWVAVASARSNPARMLLEIIWTKIGHYYGISMPWNDGLEMESLRPLLVAVAHSEAGIAGWKYDAKEVKDKLLSIGRDAEWTPSPISKAAVTTFNLLAFRNGLLDPDDDDLNRYLLEKHEETLGSVVNELIGTGHFMRERGYARPIHLATMLVENDDESGFIAHDREKLDLWCAAQKREPSFFTLIYLEGEE